jgi:hypothetical protein
MEPPNMSFSSEWLSIARVKGEELTPKRYIPNC